MKIPKLYESEFELEEGLYVAYGKLCRKYKPNLYFQMDETHTWVLWLDDKDVTIVKIDALERVTTEVAMVLYDPPRKL